MTSTSQDPHPSNNPNIEKLLTLLSQDNPGKTFDFLLSLPDEHYLREIAPYITREQRLAVTTTLAMEGMKRVPLGSTP